MTIKHVNPYWHDKDYEAPKEPKKKKYKGKQVKPLSKEEKEALAKRKKSLPWEY